MTDLTALRSFVAVVDTGSISAAARQVGYSASAVSRHVTSLEREWGVTLLARSARETHVVLAGRVIADHARLLLEEEHAFLDAVDGVRSGRGGATGVAFTRAAATLLIPSAMAALRRSHPRLSIDTAERPSDEDVAALLTEGRADIGLMWGFPEPEVSGFDTVPLMVDDLVLVTAEDRHDLHRQPLDLEALSREPRISHTVHRGAPPRVDQLFREHGLEPPPVAMRVEDHAHMLGLVRAGLGIALLPALGVSDMYGGVRTSTVVRDFRVIHIATMRGSRPRHHDAVVRALVAAASQSHSNGVRAVNPSAEHTLGASRA